MDWELSFKEVETGEKVVGTSPTLETLNQLEENPIYTVTKARVVPIFLIRMFLTFLEEKSLHVIGSDRVTWKYKGKIKIFVKWK